MKSNMQRQHALQSLENQIFTCVSLFLKQSIILIRDKRLNKTVETTGSLFL